MPRVLLLLSLLSFSASAAVLGPEVPLSPAAIDVAPFEQHITGLAGNGRDFLMTWSDRRATIPNSQQYAYLAPVYVSRLDAGAVPANAFGAKVVDGAYRSSIVRTDAGYVLLWSDANGTSLMPLNDDGASEGAEDPLTGEQMATAAASNGRTIFFVHSPDSTNLTASIFRPDGKLVSRASLSNNTHLSPAARPFVLPNGDYALIDQVWTCPGNVPCTVTASLTTMTDSGVLATRRLQDVSQWTQSTAAIGNGRMLLAWISDSIDANPYRTVSYQMFDLTGKPVTPAKVLASTNVGAAVSGSLMPSVGWDGRDFLVAWQWPTTNDERSGEIRAVRIESDGTVLDSNPVLFAPMLGGPLWFASNVASDLIAWDSQRTLSSDIVLRLAPSFDAAPFISTKSIPLSATLQTEPQITAFQGKNIAVWREGDTQPRIVAAVVGGAPVTLASGNGTDEQAPAIAASNSQLLVVWREGSSVLAKRLNGDGTAIDRNPIVIASNETTFPALQPFEMTIGVASNGTDFLIVWTSQNSRLASVRVSAAGAVDATPTILTEVSPEGYPSSPRVLWDGSQYAIAWSGDTACRVCASPPGPPHSLVWLAHVGADGKLSDKKEVWSGGYGNRVAFANGDRGSLLVWPVTSGDGAGCLYSMAQPPLGRVQTISCDTSSVVSDIDAAWDGTSFVLAWTAGTAVRAMRVTATGLPREDAFDVPPNGSTSFQPSVARSPNGVAIAYGRIADEPQYGSVARVFARTLDRLAGSPRQRSAR